MQAPFQLVASPEQAGQRIDRLLAAVIGTASRTRVKALILDGHVRRGEAVLRDPADPVRAGALYCVTFPEAIAARPDAQAIDFSVLYEDADLIVLDKPAGLVVHPAPGNADGTLVNALLAHCGDALPGIGGERRPGIVHRLDKDTSGIMVVAKTEAALAALSADFAARNVERAYLALCWGMLSPASGEFDGAIGRDPSNRKRMAVRASGGKPALTRYRTLRALHGAVSLVECRLATGRTHQIRVHLAHGGHPLLGDPVYLRRVPAAARLLGAAARQAAIDFPRQALHAATLGFTHPRTCEPLRFERRPPADFQALLACITANSDGHS
ncbi:RluA family pseudouridine synthase [Lichenicoccus sp.]|uniref:RluA family pseudouridine synthase n=1 Tax=Lichenicoccus sp. TaxID=2781899 RepID=UPI003D136928